MSRRSPRYKQYVFAVRDAVADEPSEAFGLWCSCARTNMKTQAEKV